MATDHGPDDSISCSSESPPVARFETINVTPRATQDIQNRRKQVTRQFPRTHTVEFADPPRPLRHNQSPRHNLSELPPIGAVNEEPSGSHSQEPSECTK